MPKVVDHDARRQDFIEAAYQIILEDGLDNTTVRAIAKRAGYTTGALVHYFEDKDELITHALEVNGRRVRARMEDAQAASEGHATLRGLLMEALPIDKQRGSTWPVWLAMWYRSETSKPMRKEERKRYREWIGRIESALREAQAIGELATDLDAEAEAKLLVALVDGLGVQYLMSDGRLPAATIIDMVDRYLDRLFR